MKHLLAIAALCGALAVGACSDNESAGTPRLRAAMRPARRASRQPGRANVGRKRPSRIIRSPRS